MQANRCNTRVVDLRSRDLAGSQHLLQQIEVPRPLANRFAHGRVKPLPYRGQRQVGWRGRIVNPGMRDNGNELVNAGPGYRPSRRSIGKLDHDGKCTFMQRGILTMSIHEDVRVNSLHAPRPPYDASRISSHPRPAKAAVSPLPLKVTGLTRCAGRDWCFSRTSRNPSSTSSFKGTFSRFASRRERSRILPAISNVVFMLQS